MDQLQCHLACMEHNRDRLYLVTFGLKNGLYDCMQLRTQGLVLVRVRWDMVKNYCIGQAMIFYIILMKMCSTLTLFFSFDKHRAFGSSINRYHDHIISLIVLEVKHNNILICWPIIVFYQALLQWNISHILTYHRNKANTTSFTPPGMSCSILDDILVYTGLYIFMFRKYQYGALIFLGSGSLKIRWRWYNLKL